MSQKLAGRVAIITGSSSGIGAATAIHFASLGSFVAISGRKKEKLENTRDECVRAGLPKDKVLLVIGDLTREDDAVALVNQTVDYFGKLDILVNNHGIVKVSDFLTAPLTEYDEIMATNTRSVLKMIQLCVPHLKKTKGNIVNVSSVVAKTVNPSIAAYSFSKAALDHVTKTAALQLGPFGVRVNSVNPGYIYTDLYINLGMSKEEAAKIWEKNKHKHALGRVGLALEVAQPIAFLASNEASFITGSTLLIDGGFALMGPE